MTTITKRLNILNSLFIGISIILVFASSIFITYGKLTIENYSYILVGLFFLGLFIIIVNKVFTKINFSPYLFILLYALFGLISVLLSGHILDSLRGATYRNEGYFVILSYIIMFIISSFIKDNKLKEILINIIIICGIISICYGTLEFLKIIPNTNLYPKSFYGNSNSYGELCLLLTGLSFGLYVFSKNKFYFIYFVFSIIGLITSGCMGCYVGFIGIFITYIIYLIYLKKKKTNIKSYVLKVLLLFLAAIPLFGISIGFRKHLIVDIKEVVNEGVLILQGKGKSSFGTIRLEIWNKAIKSAPKYLVHGVGVDRFQFALDNGKFRSSRGRIVDKAHNDYLQILLTQGIFALIYYLIHVFKVIITAFKESKNHYIYVALLFAIIGYLVQIFFEISVTRVAPYFFIIMGLAYKIKEETTTREKKS